MKHSDLLLSTFTRDAPRVKKEKLTINWAEVIHILIFIFLIIGAIGIFIPIPSRNTDPYHGHWGRGMNTALQVKVAISAYYTEYWRYPVNHEEVKDGDFLSDHVLMDVLLGSEKAAEENGLNPLRIAFFLEEKLVR